MLLQHTQHQILMKNSSLSPAQTDSLATRGKWRHEDLDFPRTLDYKLTDDPWSVWQKKDCSYIDLNINFPKFMPLLHWTSPHWGHASIWPEAQPQTGCFTSSGPGFCPEDEAAVYTKKSPKDVRKRHAHTYTQWGMPSIKLLNSTVCVNKSPCYSYCCSSFSNKSDWVVSTKRDLETIWKSVRLFFHVKQITKVCLTLHQLCFPATKLPKHTHTLRSS